MFMHFTKMWLVAETVHCFPYADSVAPGQDEHQLSLIWSYTIRWHLAYGIIALQADNVATYQTAMERMFIVNQELHSPDTTHPPPARSLTRDKC